MNLIKANPMINFIAPSVLLKVSQNSLSNIGQVSESIPAGAVQVNVTKELTEQQLTQCAEYFAHGSATQIFGGALVVIVFLVTAFTKHSIPDVVRKVARAMMSDKKAGQ